MPPLSSSLHDALQYSSVSISAVNVQLHKSWAHSIVCCMEWVYPARTGSPSVVPDQKFKLVGMIDPDVFKPNEAARDGKASRLNVTLTWRAAWLYCT